MATVFSRIIDGELPGRFVWKDERAVAFLSINPLRPGHTLVVPRKEVDHWIDLKDDLAAHLMVVAKTIGRAQKEALEAPRIGMTILGMEVPHVHLHVVPIESERDMDFSRADRDPDDADMDRAADAIRTALRALGRDEVAS